MSHICKPENVDIVYRCNQCGQHSDASEVHEDYGKVIMENSALQIENQRLKELLKKYGFEMDPIFKRNVCRACGRSICAPDCKLAAALK